MEGGLKFNSKISDQFVLGWQLSSRRFFLNFNIPHVIKCFWHNVLHHSKEDVLFYRNLCFVFLFESISVNFQII